MPQIQTLPIQPNAVKLNICSYCGDRIKEDLEYCNYCGLKQ